MSTKTQMTPDPVERLKLVRLCRRIRRDPHFRLLSEER